MNLNDQVKLHALLAILGEVGAWCHGRDAIATDLIVALMRRTSSLR
jgi:hypothetical protein